VAILGCMVMTRERMQSFLRRRWRGMTVGVAAMILSTIAWSVFWPSDDCGEPRCAARRFTVALELDALGQVAPIDFEVSLEDSSESLQSVLRSGGIDVTLTYDELGLPYDPSSGPLDRADLYQFVSVWRNRPATQDVDATLYALFTSALIADNGEPLFGIMFDTAGREGFAVAPTTTERFFKARAPDWVATLQLRTFTHELLHALNRHHADAVQMRDGRLTLEAPTRCISDTQRRQWALREEPLLALSPNTIRFFQTAPAQDVLPGPNNSPFLNRRVSPTECDDARANIAMLTESRWLRAQRRLRSLFSFAAVAQEIDESTDAPAPTATISVHAQPAPYPLGYPIAVRVIVENNGEEPLPIVDRLNPGYGMLTVEHRRTDETEWSELVPVSWYEPTSDEQSLLAPGERAEETIPIYFGEEGWTFNEPGTYELRVRLHASKSADDMISEPIMLAVAEPRTQDDRNALAPLLNANGQLANEVGRLLFFGGRIGEPEDIYPLEQAAQQYGHTAVGGALRLTLLSQRLRRPIDAETGLRPPPDFGDARELLEDTCTDSGVAAMTSDLLEQRSGSLPDNIRNRGSTDGAAWDGVSEENLSLRTYADPAIHPWGPTVHFCFNESQVRAPVQRSLRSLARRLQREEPTRVIVAGHSDQAGACRYNNALALRRAQAVRSVLRAAGLRSTPIEVIALGERRPVDFAADPSAQDLNRRVEILIEGGTPSDSAEPQRLMPACPARPSNGA
jgi:outer membrane protein OmpA-like peptidoglycan-associated protein